MIKKENFKNTLEKLAFEKSGDIYIKKFKELDTELKVDLELYKTLLINSYDETLFQVEMFSEYKQEFEKISETKNRKKQKYYKALSTEDKVKLEQKELVNYVRQRKVEIIEKPEWQVKLGDVCEIKKGKSITQKDTKKGKVQVVAGGINFVYLHNISNKSKNTITILS